MSTEEQTGHLPTSDAQEPKSEELVWDYAFPLLNNPFVLLDMVKVLGFSFLIVCAIFLLIGAFQGEIKDMMAMIPMLAVLIGVLAILFVFVMLVIFKNRFPARYTVNNDGAMIEVTPSQRKMNKAVVVLGFLAGKPGVAGSGMLAQSQETQLFPWVDVYRVDLFPGRRVVVLRNGWRTVARLYCTAENYEAAARMAVEGVKRTQGARASAEAEDKLFKSGVVRDLFNRWLALGIVSVILATATPLMDELGLIWGIGVVLLLGLLTGRGIRAFFGALGLALVIMAVVLMGTEAARVTDFGGGIRINRFESVTRNDLMFFVISVVGMLGLFACTVRNLLSGWPRRRHE